MRSLRAIMLSTHGYEVDVVGDAAELHLRWDATRPDLVLVAFPSYRAGILESLEKIRLASPRQRMAFLDGESLQLSPLFYNGELIRKGEGPADLIGQVGALLEAL
jgi:DNA-binding response OmpR family regulator